MANAIADAQRSIHCAGIAKYQEMLESRSEQLLELTADHNTSRSPTSAEEALDVDSPPAQSCGFTPS